MPGRKPKPIQQRINEGDRSKLGKHKLEHKLATQPKPSGTLPPCPEHLHGRAREAWAFWADELVHMQLDAKCDAQVLEGACIAYARAVDADLQVSEQGIVIYEPILLNGKPLPNLKRMKKNPAVGISLSAWAQVRHFCTEFGLSPAARSRLNVVPAADSKADIQKLLTGPALTDEERQAIMAGVEKKPQKPQ